MLIFNRFFIGFVLVFFFLFIKLKIEIFYVVFIIRINDIVIFGIL